MAMILATRLLHNAMRRLQVAFPTRLGTDFKMSNLRQDNGTAELHGPTIKSARTKALVPFLAWLGMTFSNSGSVEDRAVRKCTVALVDVYAVAYNAGMFMSEEEQRCFKVAICRFGRYYQLLNVLKSGEFYLFYHIKPKEHYIQHLPKQSLLVNPRSVQNYQDESLVGKICCIWSKSVSGPYHRTVQLSVLVKLLVGLAIRLKL